MPSQPQPNDLLTEVLDPTARAMALLRSGVPLSLLCDLAVAPMSKEIFDLEPGAATWLSHHVA